MVDAQVIVRSSKAVLHFLPALAAILFLGLTLSGCVSTPARLTLDDVYRPDPKNPRATIDATPAEARASLSVIRRGQPIQVTVPMDLELGDEISVRPPSIATIVFPEGHAVWLMPNTKVRLGSITINDIGQIFVRARGYFKVETQYWRAGVKGTDFYVHVTGNQTATVGVLEGSIGLESKTGGWKPTDVNENEVVTLDRDRAPSKQLRQRAELDAILQLMRVRPPRIPLPPSPVLRNPR